MASLTNPIEKQNIIDRFADYVQATANSGISWGTNALPFPEFSGNAGIFGGPTTGKPIEVNAASMPSGTNGVITAQDIYNTLLFETNRYTRIRNMQAVLFVTGGGGNTGSRPTAGIVFDQTRVAHMSSAYQVAVTPDRSDVSADNTITAQGIETLFNNYRTAYNTARNQSAGTWRVEVCHASCHSSCHSSRGRR